MTNETLGQPESRSILKSVINYIGAVGTAAAEHVRLGGALFNEGTGFEISAEQQRLIDERPITIRKAFAARQNGLDN